ncbi:Lrp/AsnC family transcriptional regulator [Thioalkalivibrio paradoxus]|uniref:AsnC family transcriptional regulator n=1 Tax=Thioalkalivibrio paradoxus ARh 1 TaxID=713585 RepID=W0DP84_9GAMM|nr:Lrp/AsnC family transcriptional regulator [Thioalkalivibrio paradoxus]AHE98655.1 AsnC family transcriptional regulator [Thioalkalivibrio paradoxus ARh 1]
MPTENQNTRLHPLDRTDRRILEVLQHDAGLSNQDLAEKVGLSPSPCLRRVRALEQAGIIIGRVALLDRKRLGLELTALIQIGMDRHTPERFATFEDAVSSYPEVQHCYLITGQAADYLLQVVVPDMDAYQDFLLRRITRLEGVSSVHTSFVLRRVIDRTALPLGYLPK